ncbi:MAG: lipopolysaccharide kinase InaA family protein [Dissulfurimicrobium sp.]|uniref:lipopolysaccharide kinase InaA family protein n=1 Tax=Dissulfurimicrobium sp. TaxID=2022436 RepID=UPI00404B68CF
MKFIDWESTPVLLGPGPYGKTILGEYPSWNDFIKGGLLKRLKKSRRTSVYLWQGGGRSFILKYYKSLPIPVWWPWLHGRPRRIWPIGVALERSGVPVPANAALVRPSSGITIIITKYLPDASTLHTFVTAEKANERHFARLGRLIGRLHRSGIVHGDLKWSNIMVCNSNAQDMPSFCLIDLDGALWLRGKGDDVATRARDMARFLCDGIKEQIGNDFLMAFKRGYHELWPADSDFERAVDNRLKRLLNRKKIPNSISRRPATLFPWRSD